MSSEPIIPSPILESSLISTEEWLAVVTAPRTPREIAIFNKALFDSSTAKPLVLGDWQVSAPEKKIRERAVHSFVIHIAPQMGEVLNLKSLCGSERGRACKDPTTTKLVNDRYCSRCWNRWAKKESGV